MRRHNSAEQGSAPSGGVRDRFEEARILELAEAGRLKGRSVSEIASEEGVPRSTLYHWLSRKEQLEASGKAAGFFESPDGLAWLHRIVGAAHFVFGQACGCGTDRICEFLKLSQLGRFVAGSHGTQYGVARQMEELLGEYGRGERARLGTAMESKTIALCEDETFHPEICLVAIEPASGFILLERYAESRDGATWSQATGEALGELAVEVAVVSSDEAKGLKAHVRDGLGAQHSPDLFHCQHDLTKATARPLACRLKAPAKALEEAERDTREQRADMYAHDSSDPRPVGRRPHFETRIADAEQAEQEALGELESASAQRELARRAIRRIGDAFHPFDLTTAARQSARQVEAHIRDAFETIDAVIDRAGLSQKCRDRIDKARRLIPAFRASMAFFQAQLDRTLAGLELDPQVEHAARDLLAPGLYLLRAADRARSANDKHAIRALAEHLLDDARSGPLAHLDATVRDHLECSIQGCLNLFVRASSCVEGRNGQLALRHHSLSSSRIRSDRPAADRRIPHGPHISAAVFGRGRPVPGGRRRNRELLSLSSSRVSVQVSRAATGIRDGGEVLSA